MPAAGYHPAVEEYLETILELEESGILPIRARIVERLGVSAPAVSETVRRLEREGYLVLDEGRVMRLTERGRHYATAIMRRHRLAERLLVELLHVPWHQVHEEAGRLEHAISENLERHLVAVLGDPATCPHGNPIPGSANAVDVGPLQPVADVAPGDRAVVRRVDEEIEAQPDLMLLLERAGLMPGATVQVVGRGSATSGAGSRAGSRASSREGGGDGLRVRCGDRQVMLPARLAARLYVGSEVGVEGAPEVARA